jgi:hypothetical protein
MTAKEEPEVCWQFMSAQSGIYMPGGPKYWSPHSLGALAEPLEGTSPSTLVTESVASSAIGRATATANVISTEPRRVQSRIIASRRRAVWNGEKEGFVAGERGSIEVEWRVGGD